jgi:hypothetical protein
MCHIQEGMVFKLLSQQNTDSSTSQINVEIQTNKKPKTTTDETIKMAESVTSQQMALVHDSLMAMI